MPELGNPIFPALAEEMERRAAQEGLTTILGNTAGLASREAEYVHMLLEHRVAGMIFISSEITDLRSDHEHYGQLLEEGARIVFVNGGSKRLDVTSVGVDERAAGRPIPSTCSRWVTRASASPLTRTTRAPPARRPRGGARRLRAAGFDPDGLVAYTQFGVEGGRQAFRALTARTAPRRRESSARAT